MIDGWDKGPRDRSQRASRIDKAMDWIYRLGPQVVIEVRDLNGPGGGDEDASVGVLYADLAIGEGINAHRLPLGPALYGGDSPESERCPINVPTIESAMRIEEARGRAAASFILVALGKASL